MARFTGLLVLLLSACASAFVPASPSWARGSVAVNAGPKEALDRFGASFKGIGGGNAPYTKPVRAANEGKGNVRKVGGAGDTYGDVKSLDAAFCFGGWGLSIDSTVARNATTGLGKFPCHVGVVS